MRFLSGVILMLASASAAAFTLGDARVISTEPEFKAAIPVVDLTENNHETLGGRVRSFSNYSDSLKFSVERASNGQLEFILTSNEPLMTTLALEVEITYGDEQSNREFLLKPLSEETLTVSSTIKPVESDNTKRVERVRTFDLSLTHTTHIVKPNQSLYDIAVDCKEIGGNVYQRALAIFAANKTTFTRGDINKLEQGTQLYIPQQSYVNNFDPTKSRQMFIALAQGNMDLAVERPIGELEVAKPAAQEAQTPGWTNEASTDTPPLSASAESVQYLRDRVQSLESKVERINQGSANLNEKVDALAQQLKLLLDKSL